VYSARGGSGIAALLGTIMHQPVLADIEIARAGTAAPVVRPAQGDVVLELIEASIAVLAQLLHLGENRLCFVVERTELTGAVMDDAYSRGKAQFHGAFADRHCIPLLTYPAPITELIFT